MKKLLLIFVAMILISGISFAQSQEPGFSNTIYTGVGSGSMLDSNAPRQGGADQVHFEGFVNYFTANIQASGITIAGDIAWVLLEQGSFSATIQEWNFNAIMSPFTGFDIGVGTSLEWEVGPKPFDGPEYSAYSVPEYAGLGIFPSVSAGRVSNHFADDAIAVRYEYADLFVVGAGLNGGLSNDIGAGIGIQGNILDLFTLGFAYNGAFGQTGNNFYVGSNIFVLDGFDLDLWANFAQGVNTTIGGRLGFNHQGFRIEPEFSAIFWDQNNKGNSFYAAVVTEYSLSDTMLLGLNASWGLGSDINTSSDLSDSGARVNVSPHFVWNVSNAQRLAVGINLIPVWWQDATSEFYWSIPISWKVSF